jgi:hypothetical protein
MNSPMFPPTFHQRHKIWLEAIQYAVTKYLLPLVSLRFIPSINITQPKKISSHSHSTVQPIINPKLYLGMQYKLGISSS